MGKFIRALIACHDRAHPLFATAGPHLATVIVCETDAQIRERVAAQSCGPTEYCTPPNFERQCWTEQL